MQGCANSKFPQILREYSKEFKLNILSLLEPRVSGFEADSIIEKLGLDRTHRVEAVGSREVFGLDGRSPLMLR